MPHNPKQPDHGESSWFAADHMQIIGGESWIRQSPTPPRFKVGDKVTSFNGQPRIVTGMKWAQSVRWPHQSREPIGRLPWGWVLTTVHPDDPAVIGCGFEDAYSPREESE